MLHRARAGLIAAALTCAHSASASPPATPAPATAPATRAPGCLAAGDGFLRARVRGAVTLDLDWKNVQMECAGGPRPTGNGVRVSIGGPDRGDGRRIRIVFGIAGVAEGGGGKALPTNVTILFEGEKRIFATRGDDKCTVDSLTQQRVEALAPGTAIYRVTARGFCLGPATSLTRGERAFVTSFDFAGRVEFEDDDRHADPAPAP